MSKYLPGYPESGHYSIQAACLKGADIVEKVLSGLRTKFFRAQLGEASEALNRLRESEPLLERWRRAESSRLSPGSITRWRAPVCCSAGATRRGISATARSNSVRPHKSPPPKYRASDSTAGAVSDNIGVSGKRRPTSTRNVLGGNPRSTGI